MAISSAGIGSGLDVDSIVTQLVALQKRPLTQLQTTAASIQTKISAYSQIKSLTSAFSDAASKLSRDSTWTVKSAGATSTAVSATVTGQPAVTSFSMQVQQLAASQTVASTARNPAGTAVGAGTLTLQLGTWSGTPATPAFTAGSAAAVAITVDADDTLTDIAKLINDEDMGVTATVLTDASGERLLLRSKETGQASGFRLQVVESGGAGLSSLTFDPQNSAGVGMAANTIQYAQNTKATLNGIELTSTNNVFDGAIAGLRITASEVTTQPVEVAVRLDTAAMRKSLQDFVAAYNAINDLLGTATKYDSETKTAGILQGDSSALGLQSMFRNMVISAKSGEGTYKRLSDIGIEMQRGGKLTINETKLTAALKEPEALQALMVGTDGDGLAVKMREVTTGMLSIDGLMNNKSAALSAAVKRNSADQDRVNARAELYEKRLRAQYTALDKQMGSLSALSNYVASQVSQWNKA